MLLPLQIKPDIFLKSYIDKIVLDNISDKLEYVKNFYSKNKQATKESNLIISDFLNNLFYQNHYDISEKRGFSNAKGELDLIITDLSKVPSRVGVILELKKINSNDMITNQTFLRKAFYQAVYYYLSDKKDFQNTSKVNFIVITDSIHWFFIRSSDLEDALFNKVDENQKPIKFPSLFSSSQHSTKDIYNNLDYYLKNIYEKFTNATLIYETCDNDVKLPYTYFNLQELVNLNDIYQLELFLKVLSDSFLFDKVQTEEKNSLNKKFYNELLYIIGLEEVREHKKIVLKPLNNNFSFFSLTQKAILAKYPTLKNSETIFDVCLELCLLWINRLLFIQLYSSVLQNYKIINEPILNIDFKTFNNVNLLFFNVLNVPKENREYDIFRYIPYINSSLFQEEEIESEYATINHLYDGMTVELYHTEVVKGKKKYLSNIDELYNQKINILQYLILFLNSYNITVDDSSKRTQKKDLINASVLGKIFEKINGYKDGSFYTPSYITEYMAKSSIEKTIVYKFNEAGFASTSIVELAKEIFLNDKQHLAHEVFDSITICDPAVGSGHFLVSSLNTLLLFKCRLGLLGRYLQNNQLEIIDDTLIINNIENYSIDNAHSDSKLQNIYETIYLHKKKIIENSIFGVDINSKSVKITQLRLWIELLKHTYFTQETHYKELALLPNIDINIKQGDSLLATYDLNHKFDSSLYGLDFFKKYKEITLSYKKASTKENKKSYAAEIYKIKSELKNFDNNDFDWRYEFPEVLDKYGNFQGFDIIIGNPPYFNIQTLGAKSPIAARLKNDYSYIWQDKSDIIFYFIARAIALSKNQINFIVSNAFLNSKKAEKLRNYIVDNVTLEKIINFEQYQVFQDASITTAIIELSKRQKGASYAYSFKNKFYSPDEICEIINQQESFFKIGIKANDIFSINNAENSAILSKIDDSHPKLNSLLKIGKGMETAANDVFVFRNYPKQFPAKFVKKRMGGESIKKFNISDYKEYILYFEDIENFEELPESIQDHLLAHRDILEKRATVINEGRTWWRYSRPMHKEYYNLDKIWCSYRAKENIFCFDNTCDYIGLTNTTVIFDTNENIDLKYLLALLNSKVLNFRYKSIGKQTGSGIYEYFENGVGKLPIPLIDIKDQKLYIDISNRIIESKKLNNNTDDLEKTLDNMIYDLYHIDEMEREIIESSLQYHL